MSCFTEYFFVINFSDLQKYLVIYQTTSQWKTFESLYNEKIMQIMEDTELKILSTGKRHLGLNLGK